MHALLERARSRNPAIEALVVMTAEGRPIAQDGADEETLQAIAGLVTALHVLADRSAAELGLGELETVIVHGRGGFLALAAVDDGRFLVGSTGERSMTGAVLADLRDLAARVATAEAA